VREIASGRFIANGEAVLLLGPPGVGKRAYQESCVRV
jgi:MoxR-like ATPase